MGKVLDGPRPRRQAYLGKTAPRLVPGASSALPDTAPAHRPVPDAAWNECGLLPVTVTRHARALGPETVLGNASSYGYRSTAFCLRTRPGTSSRAAADQGRGDDLAEQAQQVHVLTAIEAFRIVVGEDQEPEPRVLTIPRLSSM